MLQYDFIVLFNRGVHAVQTLCHQGWLWTSDPCASASHTLGATGMYQHTWPVHWFWRHYIYFCVLKINQIIRYSEFGWQRWFLNLARPHCTIYNRSWSSYWVSGISQIQRAPRWTFCEEFHNAIEKTHKHPCGVVFPIDSTTIYNTNTQDQWLEGLVSTQANN